LHLCKGRKLPHDIKLSLFHVQTFVAMYSHIHQVLSTELSYRIHRTVAFAFICFLEKEHNAAKAFSTSKNKAKKQ